MGTVVQVQEDHAIVIWNGYEHCPGWNAPTRADFVDLRPLSLANPVHKDQALKKGDLVEARLYQFTGGKEHASWFPGTVESLDLTSNDVTVQFYGRRSGPKGIIL